MNRFARATRATRKWCGWNSILPSSVTTTCWKSFTLHDPTTLNRQGNDVGTQYRSVIHYQSAGQESVARKVLAEMAGVWDAPIVTQLAPAATFYTAEDYHQNYVEQHPLQGYCALVVVPKVEKFRAMYAGRLK